MKPYIRQQIKKNSSSIRQDTFSLQHVYTGKIVQTTFPHHHSVRFLNSISRNIKLFHGIIFEGRINFTHFEFWSSLDSTVFLSKAMSTDDWPCSPVVQLFTSSFSSEFGDNFIRLEPFDTACDAIPIYTRYFQVRGYLGNFTIRQNSHRILNHNKDSDLP